MRLPVVGSTASSTEFVSERLDGPDGISLYLDGNGKIALTNGTYHEPRPNALSLVQVEDCPGSTPTCRRTCYVNELESARPDVHALYRANSKAIRAILAGDAAGWALRLADWISANAAGGFRWHVSGDVFSREYARWIAAVCRQSLTVPHWIYTRSFEYVGDLAASNLVVNLSADADNAEAAYAAAVEHGLRVCYMTVDGTVPAWLLEGDVVFPDYSLRPRQFATLSESPWWRGLDQDVRRMVCPVDAFGKSEAVRCGPCRKCLE